MINIWQVTVYFPVKLVVYHQLGYKLSNVIVFIVISHIFIAIPVNNKISGQPLFSCQLAIFRG